MPDQDIRGKVSYEYEPGAMRQVVADLEKWAVKQKKVNKQLDASVKKSAAQGKAITDLGKRMSLLGAATGAGFGLATREALAYSAAMREVATLSPEVQANLRGLKGEILELSAAYGQDLVTSAGAAYQAISAGVKPAEVVGFLGEASKLAVGGVTDLKTSVDVLTTSTNAWASQNLSAGRASDVLFAGVRAGKTTVNELATSMFQAAPMAAAMGVSIEEVVGATATLTKSGVPTNIAMTQIRAALVSLEKQAGDMPAVLERMAEKYPEMSEASGRAALSAFGFQETLQRVTETSEEMGMALPKVFGRIEGSMAALTISENMETARADLQSVTDSAGETEKAFKVMSKDASFQLKQFRAGVKAAGVSMADEFLPAIGDIAGAFTPLLRGFTEGSSAVKLMAGSLALLPTVMGPSLMMIGKGISLLATYRAGLLQTGGAAGMFGKAMMAGPLVGVTLLVTAVAALIGGARDLKQQMAELGGEMKDSSFDRWSQAAQKAQDEASGMAGVVADLTGALQSERKEIMGDAMSWLQYVVGVDQAVLSSGDFRNSVAALSTQLSDGRIDANEFQAELLALANAESLAAGTGRVMSEAMREQSDITRVGLQVWVERNQVVSDATRADEGFIARSRELADEVTTKNMTLDEARSKLSAYAHLADNTARIEAETAQQMAENTGAMESYSEGFQRIVEGAGEAVVAHEDLADAMANVQKDLESSLVDGLDDMWNAQQQYDEDLEEARQADIAAAQNALQRVADEQEAHDIKMEQLWHRFNTAKEGASKKAADLAIRKEQEKWSGIVSAAEAGGGENVRKVKENYEAEQKVRQAGLAQMVVDHVKAMASMQQISEDQAFAIMDSLEEAFGVDVVSPMEEQAVRLAAGIGTATSGSREDVQALIDLIKATPDELQRLADEERDIIDRGADAWSGRADDTADSLGRERGEVEDAMQTAELYSATIEEIPTDWDTDIKISGAEEAMQTIEDLRDGMLSLEGFEFTLSGKYLGAGGAQEAHSFLAEEWIRDLALLAQRTPIVLTGEVEGPLLDILRGDAEEVLDRLQDQLGQMLDARASEGSLFWVLQQWAETPPGAGDFPYIPDFQEIAKDLNITAKSWEDFASKMMQMGPEEQEELWGRMYDEIVRREKERHADVMAHLEERRAGSDKEWYIEQIETLMDAEDDRHDTIMDQFESENEYLNFMWNDAKEALRELERADKEREKRLKEAARAEKEFAGRVHDAVMEMLDEEEEAIDDQHEKRTQAIADLREDEDDRHQDIIDHLDDELEAARKPLTALEDQAKRLKLELEGAKLDLGTDEAKDGLAELNRLISDLPRVGRTVLDPTARSAVRAALASGALTERQARRAQIVLAGGELSAAQMRDLLESVSGHMDEQVDLGKKRLDQMQRELDLAEHAANLEKDRYDKAKRALDQQKKDEDELHQSNMDQLDDRMEAEDAQYEQEREHLDDLRDIEKDRHTTRLAQIEEELAAQMVLAGFAEDAGQDLVALAEEALQKARLIIAELRRVAVIRPAAPANPPAPVGGGQPTVGGGMLGVPTTPVVGGGPGAPAIRGGIGAPAIRGRELMTLDQLQKMWGRAQTYAGKGGFKAAGYRAWMRQNFPDEYKQYFGEGADGGTGGGEGTPEQSPMLQFEDEISKTTRVVGEMREAMSGFSGDLEKWVVGGGPPISGGEGVGLPIIPPGNIPMVVIENYNYGTVITADEIDEQELSGLFAALGEFANA